MNVIVLHRNFPGQFRHVVRHLLQAGHRVVGVGNMQAPGFAGVNLIRYDSSKLGIGAHRHLQAVLSGEAHGEAVAQILFQLRAKGFKPDVVLAHPGWGEALYVKDVFPDVRLVSLFEFFYHAEGVDVGFEPNSAADFRLRATLRGRNMLHLSNLELCDAGVSPTNWQKSLHPAAYQHKIDVAHEGVDTTLMAPDPQARFTLPDGRVLKPGDPVVTYVARNLEPYRGFHRLMFALPELQRRCPQAVTVIVGGDSVSYGRPPKDAPNWREKLLAEVGPRLDLSRVHFTGQIPYQHYRSLLQVSAAHVYLTYPFVLSWSMLEAMSCQCLVLGSATPPVLEVLRHNENGLTFDFFDIDGLATLVENALARPDSFTHLRQQARTDIVASYDIQDGIDHYLRLLQGS
ncbi:MAG: glycosyltransferase family 4 protein [Humidesulfovibrio sp.]|uniref:glycosyltransferase family 4 protein n=1 Tax=Humidesulfovibrio sp. TaxID=2910988 RepID=UPI0027EB7EEE|nr:glycosyltransferase family 4 protein [Humidesulfovibrio sp.]MDQ7836618.1 glycosyltransferase family 4 protein [Humidesulfovibrio sp.]